MEWIHGGPVLQTDCARFARPPLSLHFSARPFAMSPNNHAVQFKRKTVQAEHGYLLPAAVKDATHVVTITTLIRATSISTKLSATVQYFTKEKCLHQA